MEKECVDENIIINKQAAVGNDFVIILKHSIYERDNRGDGRFKVGVDLAVRNITESTVATVIFEVSFYDAEENIVDVVRHKEIDLKPGASRAVFVQSSIIMPDIVKGYDLKIARITTADVEKVQIRRHEIRTISTGAEEIRGIVKNISNIKADAALVATFADAKGEKIGVKVIQVKDIEPGGIRKFRFIFTPPEGEKVRKYTLDIGELIGQEKTASVN